MTIYTSFFFRQFEGNIWNIAIFLYSNFKFLNFPTNQVWHFNSPYTIICRTMCGTPVQAIWDQKIWPRWQRGSGKVKICPRRAWIWLWSRPDAPKLVNEPWNGSQMVPPTALDWFESISWPFEALQPLYIKEISVLLYCENYRFLKF